MSWIWLLPTILVIIITIFRKDLRFRMLLMAILSIPVLMVKPLTDQNFSQILAGPNLIIFIIWRLVIAASFAALATAVYEVLFHKKISPAPHPHRARLIWLVSGLLVFSILVVLHVSFIVAILAGLIVDLIIVLILRWDLVWDVIFSGFSMGSLYLIIFLITFRGFPGGLQNLWFSNTISGLTVWSMPIEELVAVVLFGALIGPLYIAIKALKPPVETPLPKILEKKHSKFKNVLRFFGTPFYALAKVLKPLRESFFNRVFKKKNLKFKVIFGTLIIIFSLLTVTLGIYYFVIPPKVSASTPKYGDTGAGLVDDISIKFNKPVNRDVLKFSISPEATGQWHFSKGIFRKHLFSEAVFTPDKPLAPDQQYLVKVENIQNFINTRQGGDFELSFKSEILPKIDHASITDGQTEVSLSDPIDVILTQKNNNVADYNFKFEPQVDFTESISPDSMQYTLKLNQPLTQGTAYKFSAQGWILPGTENPVPGGDWQISFTSKKPPGIANYSPQGDGVLIDTDKITLEFDKAMVQDEVIDHISFSPAIEGSWQWENPTKLVYKVSKNLSFATSYNILVSKDFHDLQGGFVDNDINVGFATIGNVTVNSFSPKNNGSGVATNATISISFNQAVDHDSAQSAFSISPNVTGSFSWNGNKMTFAPQGLDKDSSYNINIASGVKSIAGLDSTKTFSSSFSTVTSSTILDIGIDYQDRALSCEAAALKMALNYKGAGVSEDDIMSRVGYDPTIRNGNVWGNPNNAFVGDINGRQNTTGYGVYWGPIVRAANSWRSASAFSGWSVGQIAGAIAQNNPVVIWGTYGNGTRDDWQTPDGQNILAWKGEHARTIIGFSGKADNPTSFVVNDPIAGRITWSAAQLSSNMSTFGGSGVVVY